MTKKLPLIIAALCLCFAAAIPAEKTDGQEAPSRSGEVGGLALPYVFADHMVFQRDKPVHVFGSASPGQEVSVQFAGAQRSATSDSAGEWRVAFDAMAAGGPYTMTVQADRTITINDVMVGEVWLAAGQSNMEWPLEKCTNGREDASKANYPQIRLLNRLGRAKIFGPAWDKPTLDKAAAKEYYTGTWEVCSPESVGDFSGVGFYFAKELEEELEVPIGIISMPIGGTIIEAFISQEALQANRHLRPFVDAQTPWYENTLIPSWMRDCGKKNLASWIENPVGPRPGHPYEPTYLFESGIEPIIPFAIRGVIWYQGESNATIHDQDNAPASQEYCRAGIETLVKDWRTRWDDEFAFYHVQLPSYEKRPWMLFREVQLQTLETIPNSGLAVTIDVGRPKNIHPKDKREVGERLALWALAKTYGKELTYSGPILNSLRREGSELVVTFDHAGTGLKTKDGEEVKGFEIADDSGDYHAAEAAISGDTLKLRSPEVKAPASVRYAWAANPICNLANSEGLPASPFRARVTGD